MNEDTYRDAERALWDHYGLTPRERFVDVDGGRVRVLSVGSGDPLVFVHGSPNSGATWAPVVQHLPDHSCHMIDRPGTGLSTGGEETEPRASATRVLGAVLDDLELADAHLVGSSVGGWWAFVLGIEAPERVRTIAQLGAPPGLPGERLPMGVRMMALPGMAWVMGAMKPSPGVVRSLFKSIGHGPAVERGTIPAVLLEWYRALLTQTPTGRNEMRRDVKHLRVFTPRVVGLELRAEELAGLRAPTHFLWGTNDNYGGADVAAAAKAQVPGATLELLEGAGHLPWLDEPERAAAWLRERTSAGSARAA